MTQYGKQLKFVYDDGGRAEAGYRGQTSDCVCRAVAIAAEMPYQAVYELINDIGKNERKTKGRSSARTGVRKPTTKNLLAGLGWAWHPTMGIGTGTTVHLRAGELPMGRLVVQVSGHILAVIDGVIHDLHPSVDRDGMRAVYGYWNQP